MPSIDIAIQQFESMLGHERREVDPGMFAHFFGDHKLARCIVACLGRSYQFRRRSIDELVTSRAASRLARRDLRDARALRLHLYDRANEAGTGFLPTQQRGDMLGAIEHELALRGGELERLLYLDADEHAILERVAPTPTPEDVVAQYNLRVVESLLRHARFVELELRAEVFAGLIEALCERCTVTAKVSLSGGGATVRIFGNQDSLGSWSRHGRRVFRVLVELLHFSGGVRVGSASVALRSRQVELALKDEILDLLVGRSRDVVEPEVWTPCNVAAPRRTRGAGITLVRSPDIQAWSAGVLVPDLAVRRGSHQLFVCLVRSPRHAARLLPLVGHPAARAAVVFAGPPELLTELHDAGGQAVELDPANRDWLDTVVERTSELAGAA